MESNKNLPNSESIISQIVGILEHLPIDRQLQLLNFTEFVLYKHLQDIENETYQNKEEDAIVTEELKSFLKQRLKAHRENPAGSITAEELEEEIKKEYGFELEVGEVF